MVGKSSRLLGLFAELLLGAVGKGEVGLEVCLRKQVPTVMCNARRVCSAPHGFVPTVAATCNGSLSEKGFDISAVFMVAFLGMRLCSCAHYGFGPIMAPQLWWRAVLIK